MNMGLILVIVIILIALYLVATYNGFVVLKQRIQEAFSGIDVQLKRRADLIPNLVETVKGYAKHEKTIFENVTKARSALLSAKTPGEKAEANNQVTAALKTVFAVAEAYPDLKASANFQELQSQLTDTEDKVAYSRQFYNSNILDYNAKVQMFPSNFIAGACGFTPMEFFQAKDEERADVKVKFD